LKKLRRSRVDYGEGLLWTGCGNSIAEATFGVPFWDSAMMAVHRSRMAGTDEMQAWSKTDTKGVNLLITNNCFTDTPF